MRPDFIRHRGDSNADNLAVVYEFAGNLSGRNLGQLLFIWKLCTFNSGCCIKVCYFKAGVAVENVQIFLKASWLDADQKFSENRRRYNHNGASSVSLCHECSGSFIQAVQSGLCFRIGQARGIRCQNLNQNVVIEY